MVVVKGKGDWKGRDVIMAVHILSYRDCSNAKNLPILHIKISDTASFLQEVVCEDDDSPDWCVTPPP